MHPKKRDRLLMAMALAGAHTGQARRGRAAGPPGGGDAGWPGTAGGEGADLPVDEGAVRGVREEHGRCTRFLWSGSQP